MDATTRAVGPDPRDGLRRCRVIWDADGREVSVWVTNGDELGSVSGQRVDVLEAVAGRAFERVRDEARAADIALDAVEVVRDPRMIVPLTISAVVQVAAMHAGVSVRVAKLIGYAAGKLAQRLLVTESGTDGDAAVRYVDIEYDIDTGRTWPEEPRIRTSDRASRRDAIDELLDPHRRDGTPRAGRAGSVSPNLAREASQDIQPRRASRVGSGIPRPVPPTRSLPTAPGSRSKDLSRKRQPRSRGGRDGPGDLDG